MDITLKMKILRNVFDEDLATYLIKNQCVDDYIVEKIINRFGERGIVSLRNFGKGYSRRYRISLVGSPEWTIDLYTFLGRHGEYIIFPFSGYCGCYSKFSLNITRRYPCYHLISFSLDLAVDSLISFDYQVSNLEMLALSLFYDSLSK
ncbi:TPA: hypothetical protein EYP83_01890 [Candidatus Geothermarchaeota archaeon]|nr:hypothetical protein [Candidatus Geothermarchaeota archaeon]HIQ13653.1 hypothetical protein [Thermoprotei archaeon]